MAALKHQPAMKSKHTVAITGHPGEVRPDQKSKPTHSPLAPQPTVIIREADLDHEVKSPEADKKDPPNVENLPSPIQRHLLDLFVGMLEEFLSNDHLPSKNALFEELAKRFTKGFPMLVKNHNLKVNELIAVGFIDKEGNAKPYHGRQLDNFLQALNRKGLLKLGRSILWKESQELRQKFLLRDVVVAGSANPDSFAEVAAEVFMREFVRVLRAKHGKGLPTIIGLISGRTVQLVIMRICAEDNWHWAYGVRAEDLESVIVLPLNVSLADPEYIGGNATILAFQFAEKINQQKARLQKNLFTSGAGSPNETVQIAKTYGLIAPLTCLKSRLPEEDNEPPTKSILEYTEPERLGNSGAKTPQLSKLDLVLTGAGEESKDPFKSGSIFFDLAKKRGIQLNGGGNRIVGDLAFVPLNAYGESIPLCNAEGSEVVFYSTTSLKVLKSLSENPETSVILVAQSTAEKNKVPIILAVAGGGNLIGGPSYRYISHLVVDDVTARGLMTRIS